MDKIPFEDGILVTAGYVEIDGVKHEVKPAEYTGNTPFTAFNLNKMQDNIEKQINSKSAIESILIKGNSKQEITTGKNKLPNAIKTQTINNLTIIKNDDGTFLVNGTASDRVVLEIEGKDLLDVPSDNYCLSGCPLGGSKDTYTLVLGYYDENSQWKKEEYETGNGLILNKNYAKYGVALLIGKGTNCKNLLFKPMVEPGLTITEYEPYTGGQPSPNLKYSQEIESCGDNINMLLTAESEWEQGTLNGGVNQANTARIRTKNYCLIDVAEQTISMVSNLNYVYGNIFYYNSSKAYIGNQYELSGNKDTEFNKLTFTPPTEAHYCKIVIKKKDNSVILPSEIATIKPKLEKGTKATAYSKYGQGNITVVTDNNLQTTDSNYKSKTHIIPTQKPMRAIGNIRDSFVKIDGQWYEKHSIYRKMLDGTENAWALYTSGTRRFGLDLKNNLAKAISGKYGTGYSNQFLIKTNANEDLTIFIQIELGHFYIGLTDVNSKWADVNALKTYLASQYNAGTSLYVDYVLETPELIPCTTEQTKALNGIYEAYADGQTIMYSTDDIEPVIEIVKESKEQVQSETNKAISALIERVSQLEEIIASAQTTAEEGA